jgi:hypothetical protein
MLRHNHRFSFLFVPLLILLSMAVTGCGAANATPTAAHELSMADMTTMPAEVKAAPVVVQQSYQFAVANPEVLTKLPCYCGCGKMGHTSNYACYVKNASDGKVTYDNHALGCSICVDITQDAMRLSRQGKSVTEIRAYVDATYSKYGPSNLSSQSN